MNMSFLRFGVDYLVDSDGNHIVDSDGNRIIVNNQVKNILVFA